MQYYGVTTNSRWRTATMLKIVLYSEKSSDFDEIWYSSKFLNRQSRDQIVKIYKIEEWHTAAILAIPQQPIDRLL